MKTVQLNTIKRLKKTLHDAKAITLNMVNDREELYDGWDNVYEALQLSVRALTHIQERLEAEEKK